MSATVKLFERIVNHMLRTIVESGNTHFVFRRGRFTTGSTVDHPLLNTKWMLPNCTIVLSMWFIIIHSNSFTVWDISFILYSSMIPFPLNRSDHMSYSTSSYRAISQRNGLYICTHLLLKIDDALIGSK